MHALHWSNVSLPRWHYLMLQANQADSANQKAVFKVCVTIIDNHKMHRHYILAFGSDICNLLGGISSWWITSNICTVVRKYEHKKTTAKADLLAVMYWSNCFVLDICSENWMNPHHYYLVWWRCYIKRHFKHSCSDCICSIKIYVSIHMTYHDIAWVTSMM